MTKKPITFKADPMNPNRMDEADKERMKKSLVEFGDLSGITLNRRTGLLVGGHQRISVLDGCEIHATDLPKKERDGTVARGYVALDGVRYSLRVVDWDVKKAHAALLAANRFGRVGKDDESLLYDLLAELEDTNTDLTGFSAEEIAKMFDDKETEDEQKSGLSEDFDVEKMCIIVTSKTTEEQRSLFEELTERGFVCRLSSM